SKVRPRGMSMVATAPFGTIRGGPCNQAGTQPLDPASRSSATKNAARSLDPRAADKSQACAVEAQTGLAPGVLQLAKRLFNLQRLGAALAATGWAAVVAATCGAVVACATGCAVVVAATCDAVVARTVGCAAAAGCWGFAAPPLLQE